MKAAMDGTTALERTANVSWLTKMDAGCAGQMAENHRAESKALRRPLTHGTTDSCQPVRSAADEAALASGPEPMTYQVVGEL